MEFGVFIHISASENSMYVYCIQLFFMQGVDLHTTVRTAKGSARSSDRKPRVRRTELGLDG
jgi:hypothetical protein